MTDVERKSVDNPVSLGILDEQALNLCRRKFREKNAEVSSLVRSIQTPYKELQESQQQNRNLRVSLKKHGYNFFS